MADKDTDQPSPSPAPVENNPFPPCELDEATNAIYQDILAKRPDVEKLGIDTGLQAIGSGPRGRGTSIVYATVEQAEALYSSLSTTSSKEYFSLDGKAVILCSPSELVNS